MTYRIYWGGNHYLYHSNRTVHDPSVKKESTQTRTIRSKKVKRKKSDETKHVDNYRVTAVQKL